MFATVLILYVTANAGYTKDVQVGNLTTAVILYRVICCVPPEWRLVVSGDEMLGHGNVSIPGVT